METVIAKTRKSFLASYIVIIVFGALLLIFGIATLLFFPDKRFMSVIFIPVGGALLGIGIGWTVYFSRLPKNCITFKEGKIRLHNGLEFSPAEINYCTGSTWGPHGAMWNYGTLIISVRNIEYKYKFVDDVETVASQINAIKAQFAAIEEVQKHIAERQATENANVTEENKEV